MTPRPPRAALVALLTVIVAACSAAVTPASSSGTPSNAPSGSSAAAPFLPVPVTSFFRVGDNRIVFGLLDPAGQKEVSGPDRTLSIAYHGPSGQSIAAAKQTFIWAIEGVRGVYVGRASFPTAGKWTADFTSQAPGSPPATVTFSLDVLDRSPVVSPGDQAPSIDTPTLADVGGDLAKISTDAKPEKRFYETSEADALAAHKPFVLIFATPKFCKTATCGPTLDKLKPVAAAHPEMTFINVEPYELTYENGGLQAKLDATNQLIPVPATNAFKLTSEPYVFVIGADGVVSAAFELVFSPDEIEAAIKAVE
jgi:hypothetical protein